MNPQPTCLPDGNCQSVDSIDIARVVNLNAHARLPTMMSVQLSVGCIENSKPVHAL
jgi:hypothetical protein